MSGLKIGKLGSVLIGAAFLLGIVGAGGLYILSNSDLNGPARCWMQENLYDQSWADAPPGTPIIEVDLVTQSVRDACDAADDPAIWPAISEAPSGKPSFWVLGTNKQRSLNVYGPGGAVAARADDLGAPNNVDMRKLNGRVLAFASEKDAGHILGFAFDPKSGALTPLEGSPFAAREEDEVYGLCLYRSPSALYVFTTDKSGLIAQYEVIEDAGNQAITLEPVRTLRVATQPEACVVDDAGAMLFVAEEDVGIWRFDAGADAGTDGELIARTGTDGTLSADVEGLALYTPQGPAAPRYLVASSQGDNSYSIYDLAAPHRHRGRFQLAFKGELIGDTDGIEVSARDLGGPFSQGLMVVQDGFVRTGGHEGAQNLTGERRNQRFAYVSWEKIARTLGLGESDQED